MVYAELHNDTQHQMSSLKICLAGRVVTLLFMEPIVAFITLTHIDPLHNAVLGGYACRTGICYVISYK